MNVSLIIPTYNGKLLLQKHLNAVLQSLRADDELIIVDDASTDETSAWLINFFHLLKIEAIIKETVCYCSIYKNIDIKILINQSNSRFAISCNRGAQIAKNPILVLLNNDVSPQSDFLKFLLPHFDDASTFAVGCKEIAAKDDNKQYGKSEAHFERGFFVHMRAIDQDSFGETAWVSGGSGAFRLSMWKQLNGFDCDYKPAYVEDIDLSYRAHQKGWYILFEPKAIVFHIHESTNKAVFGSENMEIMSFKNAILFMWKNAKGIELMKHFVWLPYHLVFTTIRSNGKFSQGFYLALRTINLNKNS